MDELFESVKVIVSSTMFGASGSGAVSYAQPSIRSTEVTNAKEILRAALKMNVKTTFHPGRVDALREAIQVLNAAKVLLALANSSLLAFGDEFSTFSRANSSVSRDLQIIEEKLQ